MELSLCCDATALTRSQQMASIHWHLIRSLGRDPNLILHWLNHWTRSTERPKTHETFSQASVNCAIKNETHTADSHGFNKQFSVSVVTNTVLSWLWVTLLSWEAGWSKYSVQKDSIIQQLQHKYKARNSAQCFIIFSSYYSSSCPSDREVMTVSSVRLEIFNRPTQRLVRWCHFALHQHVSLLDCFARAPGVGCCFAIRDPSQNEQEVFSFPCRVTVSFHTVLEYQPDLAHFLASLKKKKSMVPHWQEIWVYVLPLRLYWRALWRKQLTPLWKSPHRSNTGCTATRISTEH